MDKFIETVKHVFTLDEETWKERFHFFLFMIMGAGANWVYATALAQEIPYFETRAPEGLCIATYMNAVNNFGYIALIFFVLYNNYVKEIPHKYSVPTLLSISAFGSFLAAGVYNITLGNVSFFLYICVAIGGCVGALASVIMVPFLTNFKSNKISAARGGGSFFILLTALISLAQNPGSSHERFNASVYFIIIGCIMLTPVIAYFYIVTFNVGRREKQINDNAEIKVTPEGDELTLEPTGNPMGNPLANDAVNGDVSAHSVASLEIEAPSAASGFSESEIALLEASKQRSFLDNIMIAITTTIIPERHATRYPWLRKTIPYMLTVGFVDFNTWGMTTALFPFAMANVSPGSGAVNLSIAYQLGSVLLVCGDLSTTLFKIPIFPAILVYTICVVNIYAAAGNATAYQTSSGPPVLIVLFCIQRFCEAHILTTVYRTIATEYPLKYREVSARAVGVADQTLTTLGAVLSTVIVATSVSCSSKD